jgi:CheY-like chemotaxis protein
VDGFVVLERLRDDPATRNIPVVICTSHSVTREEQSRLGSVLDIIPKSMIATRDLAAQRFGEALHKAGLSIHSGANSQAVEAR